MRPDLPANSPYITCSVDKTRNRFVAANAACRRQNTPTKKQRRKKTNTARQGGLSSRYLDDALILMSTPAGRLSLFSASIVLAVAWTISISRL